MIRIVSALACSLCALLASTPLAAQTDALTTGAVIATVPTVDSAATDAATTTPLSVEAARALSPNRSDRPTSPAAAPVAAALSTEPVVLATWKGGSLTNQELSATLKLRKPKRAAMIEQEAILRLPADQLREIVRDIAFEEILVSLAADAGITSRSEDVAKALDQHRQQIYNRTYYDRVLAPRLEKADEASAREYYEKNKDQQYKTPERFEVREIFVPFLDGYAVKAGDTLEKIAAEIAGTAAAADEIRRFDELKYFRRPPADLRDSVPFEPLKAGERLLVPVSKDEESSRTRLLEGIRERVGKGESFETLAREFSRAPVADKAAAFEADLNGMVPALARAIRETSAGQVSRVVRSPYGAHLFQVARYVPPSVEPFESARQYINLGAEERTANAKRVKEQLFDELAAKHGLKINTEALSRPDYAGADPLVGSSALAEAPGFKYTLDMFQEDILPTLKNWTSMTKEERINLVKASSAVTTFLVEAEARAMDMQDTDQFDREMESRAVMEISGRYLEQAVRKQMDATEGQLREFYSANKDLFTSPPLATVREITKRVNLGLPDEQKNAKIAEARAALETIRGGIKSLADFEAQARRESQNIATRSRGGLVGTHPLDFRGEVFKNQLLQLKPGEVSEPFLYGNEMMIVRLDALSESTVAPFDQVMGAVAMEYRKRTVRDFEKNFRDKTLGDAGFEVKF